MEKFQVSTPEMEPKPKESNASQEIAGSVDTYPETGGVSVNEAKKQEGEVKIKKVQNEIKEKFPPDEPAKPEKELVMAELPPNTPPIFQQMPEIAKYVTEYMEDYNKRAEAKGLKKFWNKLTGDEEELIKLGAAAKKAISRDFKSHYLRALEKRKAEGAWDYVKTLVENKYAGVDENGDIQLKGKFRVAAGEESALKGGQ